MKKFLGAVLIICLCMFFGSALYSEDLPEEGMDPGYEPENVEIEDENISEDVMPVNKSEIKEESDLKDDEQEEDADYNAFENKIDEIKDDQEAITK